MYLVDSSVEEQVLKFRFSPTSLVAAICLLSLISLGSQPDHAQQATEKVRYDFVGSTVSPKTR